MDIATIAGIVLALGFIFMGILVEGADVTSVFLAAPMILVIGGTLGAGLASSTFKDVLHAIRTLPHWMTFKKPDPTVTIDTVVSLADRARREGLLSLEEAAREVEDEFLRDGLQAAIDGTDPDDLRDMLEARIWSKRSEDRTSAKYFNTMGGYAPTIGIIGTVVSLVHVLENLAKPEELGHMIGAAFVATLWGLLSANLIWLPIGARINRCSELEAAHMELTVEGLLAIQAGANPRLVGQRLRSLVPPSDNKDAEAAQSRRAAA